MNLREPTAPLERLFLDPAGLPDAAKMAQVNEVLLLYTQHQLTLSDATARLQSIAQPAELQKGADGPAKADNAPLPVMRPVVAPGSRRKPRHWTADEDERLVAAVQCHGSDSWPLIAGIVGDGRMRAQCAQRWHRGLDPKLLKCNWSQEEEQKLLDSVAVHGETAWTRVAADMGNRSDVQCRFRYRFLCKKAKELGTEVRPISAALGKMTGQRQEEPSDDADRAYHE
jgi:hypothetical protein